MTGKRGRGRGQQKRDRADATLWSVLVLCGSATLILAFVVLSAIRGVS